MFQLFFSREHRPGKCLLWYSRQKRKNAFLGYKNNGFKKSKNWHFSMVLVQKWQFFPTFFLGNVAQKNVFCDVLERKNAFLGNKNSKFKKTKNWYFSKAVNPWFWVKNGHCSKFFFLGNIGQENVYYDILDKKKETLF